MAVPGGVRAVGRWLGFGAASGHAGHGHVHDAADAAGGHGHGHTHGTIDPTIATTTRGIWAIKWSFVILAITAAIQFVVVLVSASVALLADMIHNVGDAATAIPLWIAFLLARRPPSARFTYGYGRVEDLAGVAIVLIILASALVAAWQAIDRLVHPQAISYVGWIALAGLIGFIGNEVVAVLRIRVGREINSAALIADGYHARTDGLTSLAVVLGALGVWMGFPLADPIVGLLITIAIFAIVWQSAKAVFTRMLDGVEPEVIAQIRHAAGHVPGIREVLDVRARWLGHRLQVELDVAVDGDLPLHEADALTGRFEQELFAHLPALGAARIRVRASDAAGMGSHAAHAHAPAPVRFRDEWASGVIEIIDTPAGERLRLTLSEPCPGLSARVEIDRGQDGLETLALEAAADAIVHLSRTAPAEPHEFSATLHLDAAGRHAEIGFAVSEPAHTH